MDFPTINSTGLAAMFLYLVYRDLIQPRLNGRNGKQPEHGNTHPCAKEADLVHLDQNHQEHRAQVETQYAEIIQRLTRVETLVEQHLQLKQ